MIMALQPPGGGILGLVRKCPRCGALAPLMGKNLVKQYPDGVCAHCLSERTKALVDTLKDLSVQVGRFLVEAGVCKANEVLPKGEALYVALKKAAEAPEDA